MMSTVDLYTIKDKKEVREKLIKEQNYICPITKSNIGDNQGVLDHKHDIECLVRAVLSRQSNSFIGVLENAWNRYLVWNTDDTLPSILRNTADFLETNKESRWRHDSWLSKVKTEFNKLKEGDKDKVLIKLGSKAGKNGLERKKLFSKVILNKELGYTLILSTIKHKGN